ncbi:deoxyribodipyrimidine photo-lyase [Desulfoferrobacter suflitae]|uniref:deoxyribodipyrimidine photo-lyase n=1 Tax=Desulfoferrobacter suflitae TaxID=2865782 RepID=UPI0021646F34|nr:deoxyribodipyrimidine photo-lyase [Desulfoferrobacter suflitae]MCK8601625.1 deoxyribodipyrimidine photo-lyase [Desulfoferrobacter suflitae]
MGGQGIQGERIQVLKDGPVRAGEYVLYWMQQSQRAEFNHALEHGVELANELDLPLVVVFGLMDNYPEGNARHYRFLLEGLKDVQESLAARRIKMLVKRGSPAEVAVLAGGKAALIVCDRGYLRHQKAWRREVADRAECRVVQVESDVVVPVETVSGKAEYAARTIRPKLEKLVDRFLVGLDERPLTRSSLHLAFTGLNLQETDVLLNDLRLDRSVGPVDAIFQGGTAQAKRHLQTFLQKKLSHYSENRGQPQTDSNSCLSMYLHFGHISPVYLAMQVTEWEHGGEGNRAAFLEELIVRRELACNFVHYTGEYDSFASIPEWCRKTLGEHAGDEREFLYGREQLENAATHDTYWNAAMKEMRITGYMHNHMRMYWGKKILEWCADPEQAFEVALALNNKYFLDGRDANSYAGVAWIFGLHDRPWKERPVFGKVRYMSAAGLERKCDIGAYVGKVDALVREFGSD